MSVVTLVAPQTEPIVAVVTHAPRAPRRKTDGQRFGQWLHRVGVALGNLQAKTKAAREAAERMYPETSDVRALCPHCKQPVIQGVVCECERSTLEWL